MPTLEVISFNYFGQQAQSTCESKNISQKRLKSINYHGNDFLDVDINLNVHTAPTTVLRIIYSEQ